MKLSLRSLLLLVINLACVMGFIFKIYGTGSDMRFLIYAWILSAGLLIFSIVRDEHEFPEPPR